MDWLMRRPELKAYLKCWRKFSLVREITFASDFDGLPFGVGGPHGTMRGCGTRPMGVQFA